MSDKKPREFWIYWGEQGIRACKGDGQVLKELTDTRKEVPGCSLEVSYALKKKVHK